jgi:hypothetical protein
MTPDTPLDDAVMRLRQGPPGRAEYTREPVDNGQWETVWVIYDESPHLRHMGAEPTVEFRASAFDEGGVVVLPILLRVGPEASGRLYDTCINAYQIEGENVYLEDLARQDHVRIHLYDEQGRLQGTLTAPNSLQSVAQHVLEHQAAYQPSTLAAFEYARDKLLANNGGTQALWQTLGRRDGSS